MGVHPVLRLLTAPDCRYRKAFDVEPSLHSGINAAVLLIAAGQQFEDSEELQLIGEPNPSPLSPPKAQREEDRETEPWAGAKAKFIPFGLFCPCSHWDSHNHSQAHTCIHHTVNPLSV